MDRHVRIAHHGQVAAARPPPGRLVLIVDPIVVQGERRWTDELGRTPLELVDSRALAAGALHLTYRPVYEA